MHLGEDWRRTALTWAQTQAFGRRVEQARRALLRLPPGPVCVSTSWGKDSIVLCDLAIDVLGADRVTLVHLGSPYELPGYEPTTAHFTARAPVVTLESGRTYEDVVAWLRVIGLDHERETKHAQQRGQKAKKERMRAWMEEHGVTSQAMGLRAEESATRRGLFQGRGLTYRTRDGVTTACPLGWWTGLDVWAWIASRSLPYHRLYDAETDGYDRTTARNTGSLTTVGAGTGRLQWLRRHFRAEWERLVAEFPQVLAMS